MEQNWSNDVTWHALLFLAGDSTIKGKIIWYRPIYPDPILPRHWYQNNNNFIIISLFECFWDVCIYFCFQLPTFSPPVLVPGFDLRVGQVERCCQLHSVLHAQVLLPLKTALQLGELMVSEGGPRFPRLLQANLRAVSAARDLPVALLFHWNITYNGRAFINPL